MSKLVQAARAYLGVRWKHLGRSKSGLDCAGLPIVAYADCGVVIDAPTRYGRDPFKEGLMQAVVAAVGAPVWTGAKGSCRLSMLQPGDVVAMAPAGQPRHLAIVGDEHPTYGLTLIHADGSPGAGRVMEHGLGDFYLRQIVSVFRRPVE